MGFSLSGFIGGFASAGSRDIRLKEQRAYEERQRELEESLRVNREVEAERRERKRELEELTGELEAYGYAPETVAEIVRRGKGAAKLYSVAGMEAWKKGLDPNTLVSIKAGEIGSRALAESISESAATAATPARVTTGVSAVGAMPVAAPETGPIDVQTAAAFTPDREAMRSLFAEPPPVSASYGAEFARLSQVMARKPNSDEAKAAKQQFDTLMVDYKQYLDASKEDEAEEKPPTFNLGTLESTRTAALRTELNAFGFKTDLEGNIMNAIEGEEYKQPIAELRAAQYLDNTYRDIEDPNMKNAVSSIRLGASQRLNSYVNSMRNQYANNPENPPSRFKIENNVDSVISKAENGAYNIGDVIQINEDGRVYTVVYTGVPDVTGLPFYMPSMRNR